MLYGPRGCIYGQCCDILEVFAPHNPGGSLLGVMTFLGIRCALPAGGWYKSSRSHPSWSDLWANSLLEDLPGDLCTSQSLVVEI